MNAVEHEQRTISQPVAPHFGYLDSLRGLAILGVILVHSAILTGQTGTIFHLAFTGQRGVQLFYMVSAFTLFLSLDSKKSERHPIRNFFIRRFFRIAPLFYLAMAANFVLSHYTPHKGYFLNTGWFGIALGLIFLHGWRPDTIVTVVIGGWSIAVETSFYLLLPMLHKHVKTIKQAIFLFLVSAAALGSISRVLALRSNTIAVEQYFSFLWFPVEFPVFVLGIFAYLSWKSLINGQEVCAQTWRNASLLLLFTAGMIYFACLPFTDQKLYFSSFLFLPLILALAIHPWPFLVNRFTRYIGKISYSLYLLHFFVLAVVDWLFSRLGHAILDRFITNRPLGCVIGSLLVFGISVPLCVLSWRFIEQPGIRLGRRLIDRLESNQRANAPGGGSFVMQPCCLTRFILFLKNASALTLEPSHYPPLFGSVPGLKLTSLLSSAIVLKY